MKTLQCELLCRSHSDHLSQIYTGFGELQKNNHIDVKLKRMKDFSSNRNGAPTLLVRVNNELTIAYDTSDEYTLHKSISAEQFDYCFKRSYREGLGDPSKTLPLGLNYAVCSPNDFYLRLTTWSRNVPHIFQSLILRHPQVVNRLDNKVSHSDIDYQVFQGLPLVSAKPLVLFIARLWDPDRATSTTLREERHHINYLRIACIHVLRKELGDQFVGGLQTTEYALRKYPDYLLANQYFTKKASYLRLMHNASVCIATLGLAGSVGWKFAEYVAAAKAIVTERFNCRLPGEFTEETNYFSFESVDECVGRVIELLDDHKKRFKMMWNNYVYYQSHLRPDILVWNSLIAATRSELLQMK